MGRLSPGEEKSPHLAGWSPDNPWQAPTEHLHGDHLTAPPAFTRQKVKIPCGSPAPQSMCVGIPKSQDALDEVLCYMAHMPALMAELKTMA